MKIWQLNTILLLLLIQWQHGALAIIRNDAPPLCADIDAKECRNNLHQTPPGNFETYVAGRNRCYMTQGYFPNKQLETLLPESMTIPDNSVMQAFYPGIKLQEDSHPFLLSFCHGSEIHDVFTNINLPEQEEIMFVIPVMFKNEQGDVALFSYVPVLYLDSFIGVVGGLYFGLRKEYHPDLENIETPVSKSWRIDGFIDASFEMQNTSKQSELPPFIEQIFSSPFVSVSYPAPFSRTMIYQARVFPETVTDATATFHWQYQGCNIKSTDDSRSVYSEYRFDMSHSSSSEKYFEQLSQP